MAARLRWLLISAGPRLILRLALALVCFAIAIPLMFMPGPAIVFWLAGLLVLGFSVRDIVMFLHRVIPGFERRHAEAALRHRWIRWIDRLSARWFGSPLSPDVDEDPDT